MRTHEQTFPAGRHGPGHGQIPWSGRTRDRHSQRGAVVAPAVAGHWPAQLKEPVLARLTGHHHPGRGQVLRWPVISRMSRALADQCTITESPEATN